uniref:Uncharacterized protein n=1 Tax=viral metagenome TaxID=1070528 RepID=A0A6H1ZY12_9ZZZZ
MNDPILTICVKNTKVAGEANLFTFHAGTVVRIIRQDNQDLPGETRTDLEYVVSAIEFIPSSGLKPIAGKISRADLKRVIAAFEAEARKEKP